MNSLELIMGGFAALLTLLGLCGGVIKWVLGIYEHRLDERYAMMEAIRSEASAHWERAFATLTTGIHELSQQTGAFRQAQTDLRQYVDATFVRKDSYQQDREQDAREPQVLPPDGDRWPTKSSRYWWKTC